MNNKPFDYGATPYTAKPNLCLNAMSIFARSIHHSSHHEHLAH